MERKNPIFKAPGIDIPATLAQLDEGEEAFIPYRSDLDGSALRTAVCRANAAGDPKYSVHKTLNGHIITRRV